MAMQLRPSEQLNTTHNTDSALARSLTVSVLPVPAGPSGAPPQNKWKAPMRVLQQRSVRGVMTRRGLLPRYSKAQKSSALIILTGMGFLGKFSLSQQYLSCAIHWKSWIFQHFSFSRDSITSLPCTSIVTKAPRVSLSSSERSVLTSFTISRSSFLNCSKYWLTVLLAMAYSAWIVHLTMLTASTVWAGHIFTQSTLSDWSSDAVLVMRFKVSIMTPSISDSHLSTLPFFYPSLTSTFLEKVTFSFSMETIPDTIPPFISSCPMPSKHLLMCLWTVSGSLVWARISRSSSSDRKQKRGKNLRLVSKYSDRLFWISSRSWLSASNSLLYLSPSMLSHMFLSFVNCSIVSFQCLSTASNLAFSAAIFCWMSSDEKMGSRYIQPLWVFIQFSRVSWIRMILVSTVVAFPMMGRMQGLDFIISRAFRLSSKICWASSIFSRMKVLALGYGLLSTSSFLSSSTMPLSFFSRLYCLSAFLLISSICSLKFPYPESMTYLRVNSSLGSSLAFSPQASEISLKQFGLFMRASVASSSISQRVSLKFSISAFISTRTLLASSLPRLSNSLVSSIVSFRYSLLMVFSSWAKLFLSRGPLLVFCFSQQNLMAVSHILTNGAELSSMLVSWSWLDAGWLNMASRWLKDSISLLYSAMVFLNFSMMGQKSETFQQSLAFLISSISFSSSTSLTANLSFSSSNLLDSQVSRSEMIFLAYSMASLISEGASFSAQKLSNTMLSMLNMYFSKMRKQSAMVSTSFFSFCIVVSFSLSSFFSSLSSFSCIRPGSVGCSLTALSLQVFWMLLIFSEQMSWIFFRIQFIISRARFTKISLAALVLTWNSPQLTSSISILSIVHLAFHSSCSLLSMSSLSKQLIAVFPSNSFFKMEEVDFSIRWLKALKQERISRGRFDASLTIPIISSEGSLRTGSSRVRGQDGTESRLRRGMSSFSILLKLEEMCSSCSKGSSRSSSTLSMPGSKKMISSASSSGWPSSRFWLRDFFFFFLTAVMLTVSCRMIRGVPLIWQHSPGLGVMQLLMNLTQFSIVWSIILSRIMWLNNTSNLMMTLLRGSLSQALFSVTKNRYSSLRMCWISLTICDLQMISQFSLEFLASLSILSRRSSREKMLMVSVRLPSRWYFFMISVPFCRICFSHLSSLGRLEMWMPEISEWILSKLSNLLQTGATRWLNSSILGEGSGTYIVFLGSYSRNFFSWFRWIDLISSIKWPNDCDVEYFCLSPSTSEPFRSDTQLSSMDSIYLSSLMDWSACFWRSLVRLSLSLNFW